MKINLINIIIIVLLLIIIFIVSYNYKSYESFRNLDIRSSVNGKPLFQNDSCINWKIDWQNKKKIISATCNRQYVSARYHNKCQPYKCMVNNKPKLLCGKNDTKNGKVCQRLNSNYK
jgi:hypothetical protein